MSASYRCVARVKRRAETQRSTDTNPAHNLTTAVRISEWYVSRLSSWCSRLVELTQPHPVFTLRPEARGAARGTSSCEKAMVQKRSLALSFVVDSLALLLNRHFKSNLAPCLVPCTCATRPASQPTPNAQRPTAQAPNDCGTTSQSQDIPTERRSARVQGRAHNSSTSISSISV
jgi:hypothetical protein